MACRQLAAGTGKRALSGATDPIDGGGRSHPASKGSQAALAQLLKACACTGLRASPVAGSVPALPVQAPRNSPASVQRTEPRPAQQPRRRPQLRRLRPSGPQRQTQPCSRRPGQLCAFVRAVPRRRRAHVQARTGHSSLSSAAAPNMLSSLTASSHLDATFAAANPQPTRSKQVACKGMGAGMLSSSAGAPCAGKAGPSSRPCPSKAGAPSHPHAGKAGARPASAGSVSAGRKQPKPMAKPERTKLPKKPADMTEREQQQAELLRELCPPGSPCPPKDAVPRFPEGEALGLRWRFGRG